MQIWKLTFTAAVFAMVAQAQQDGQPTESEPAETEPTETEEEVTIKPLNEVEKSMFLMEEKAAKAFDGNCLRCLYGGYSYCTAEDGTQATGVCQPAFCDESSASSCVLRNNSCPPERTILGISECELPRSDSCETVEQTSLKIKSTQVDDIKMYED